MTLGRHEFMVLGCKGCGVVRRQAAHAGARADIKTVAALNHAAKLAGLLSCLARSHTRHSPLSQQRKSVEEQRSGQEGRTSGNTSNSQDPPSNRFVSSLVIQLAAL